MTKTQSASQDPRTNLRKGSLPAIMVPRLSHLMKEDSETRLSIRRSSASSLSVSPNCLKDQICVDTPNPLQALPPSPSVSPRSPRSPSNAELEKERALQRWQAEPGIAKMFLRCNMVLITTIASARKQTAEGVLDTLAEFYESQHLVSTLTYRLLDAGSADSPRGEQSCCSWRSGTPYRDFLLSLMRTNEGFNRFAISLISTAIKSCLLRINGDKKAVLSLSQKLDIIKELLLVAGELLSYVPDELKRSFCLMRMRMKAVSSRRICVLVTQSLVCCPLREVASLLFEDLPSKDITRALHSVADLTSSIATSAFWRTDQLNMSESGKEVSMMIFRFTARITTALKVAGDDDLSHEVPGEFALIERLGHFVIKDKMLRSALQESHFGLSMPVSLWNSSMIGEFAEASGLGRYRSRIEERVLSGYDLLDESTARRALYFINRPRTFNKLYCGLVSVDYAYQSPMSNGVKFWTPSTVCCWIDSVGFHEYARLLHDFKVDGHVLGTLSDRQLLLMGVVDKEDRASILHEISVLMNGDDSSSDEEE